MACAPAAAAVALASRLLAQQAPPAIPAEPAPPPAAHDRYLVTLGASEVVDGSNAASSSFQSGRLILFLTPASAPWDGIAPAEGPFLGRLQPVASIPLRGLAPGATVAFEATDGERFGPPLDELEGRWRVQAVVDIDFTERGHLGPGNLVSEIVELDLDREVVDEIRLVAGTRLEPTAPPEIEGVEWIERRSELLSRHFGREFRMRAGVVTPYGYDDLSFPRRFWPTIFVVGGFGANHLAAADLAGALRAREARGAVPQAVWVFLDADTPWGHSGFCDSETNGPVGTALVEEFIPFLEERFRLVAAPEARLVTGHSSGGWTALHLLTTYPETFGRAWASAPDPVDFTAFGRIDLTQASNLFRGIDGSPVPAARAPLGPDSDLATMLVEDEYASERAIDPDGRSGEQWSAWEAMWSPFDPARGGPRALCDPATGALDPRTVEAWSAHDLARRLEADPARLAPILARRARILCGTRDTYYLNEAVARLKARLEHALSRLPDADAAEAASIELLAGLTHDSAYPVAQMRFHREMRDHLLAEGLAERVLPQPRSTATDATKDADRERLDGLRDGARPAPTIRDDTPRRRPRPQ
ncbi:MAG: hypothetical protein RIS86_389 [Planctomycetota bacterium]